MKRLLAFAALTIVGCRSDLINRRTQAMIERELETARVSGFHARFATAASVLDDERLATNERAANVTLLVLHPLQARVYPGEGLARVWTPYEIDERVRNMVSAYLAYDDLDGAARALVRVYSELLRDRANYHPTRALAPLLPPEPAQFRPLETAHWGLPLALLTALFGIRVLIRRQATGR